MIRNFFNMTVFFISMLCLCNACDDSSAEIIDIQSPVNEFIDSVKSVFLGHVDVSHCYEYSMIHAFSDIKECSHGILEKTSDATLLISFSRSTLGVYSVVAKDKMESYHPNVFHSTLSVMADNEVKYHAVSGTITLSDTKIEIDAVLNTYAPHKKICSSDNDCECFTYDGDGKIQFDCDKPESENPYHLKLNLNYHYCEFLNNNLGVDLQQCPDMDDVP